MSTLIRMRDYRGVSRRDLPLGASVDDWDLVPVAGLLWLASIARLVLALLHHEVFGAEATFALMSCVLLPWLVLRARNSRDTRGK